MRYITIPNTWGNVLKSSAKFLDVILESCNSLDYNHKIDYHVHDTGNLIWKQTHIRGHYYLETGGYNGWSNFKYREPSLEDKQRLLDVYQNKFDSYKKVGSIFTQPSVNTLNITKEDGWGFFPLQMQYDSVTRLWDKSLAEILEQLYINMKTNHELKLIIKPHPNQNEIYVSPDDHATTNHQKAGIAHLNKILGKLDTLDNIRIVDSSIFEIFKKIKFVVVLNSGVGFEALSHNIPTYSLAKSDYVEGTKPINLDFFKSGHDEWTEEELLKQKYVVAQMYDHWVTSNDRTKIMKILKDDMKRRNNK